MTTPPHKSSADGKVRVGKLVPLAVIVAIVMATLCGIALWMRPELLRHHTAVVPEDPLIAAARKVGEEGVEAALAGTGESDERLVEELADLWFHSYVLLAARGLDPVRVEEELRRRVR